MATIQETDGLVAVEAKGRTFNLPRLSIRAYLPWLSELTAERRKAANELIPQNMQGVERFNLRRVISADEATLDQIGDLLWQAPPQIRVIEMSCEKGKIDAPDKEFILDNVPPHEITELAFTVSGLRSSEWIQRVFHPPTNQPNQKQPPQSNAPEQPPTFTGQSPAAASVRPLAEEASESQSPNGLPTSGASGNTTSNTTSTVTPSA